MPVRKTIPFLTDFPYCSTFSFRVLTHARKESIMKKISYLLLSLLLGALVLLGLMSCGQGGEDGGKTDGLNVTMSSESVIYDGAAHSLTLVGLPEGATVTYDGAHEFTDAGTYTIRATVTVPKHDPLTLSGTLTIRKAQVAKPVADLTSFVYTGEEQIYRIVSNPRYTVDGNKRTAAGTQTVTVTLKDKTNYEWTDGTSADLSFDFTIARGAYDMSGVRFTDGTATYDGEAHSLFADEDTLPAGVRVTYENNGKTDVGVYTVTAHFQGAADFAAIPDRTATLTIVKAKVTKPAADTTDFIYNGAEQTYRIEESDLYTVAGNKRTKIGSQTVTVSLSDKANYAWEDGTTDDLTYTFAIAGQSLSFRSEGIEISLGSHQLVDVQIIPEESELRDLTWSSSDPDVATVENGNIVAKKVGVTTITAKLIGTEASASLTITVVDPLNYELTEDSSFYKITGYRGTSETIVIPEIYDGLRVTEIAAGAFRNNTNLVSIVIPNNVSRIGAEAFSGCVNLKEINLPSRVAMVAEKTFYGCSSLTEIVLPASVASVGASAFEGCAALKTVQVNGDAVIGERAFYSDAALKTVQVNGDAVIGERAFYNDGALESVTFARGAMIGENVFASCKALRTVSVGEGNSSIGKNAFKDCSALTEVSLAEGLANIGDFAFDYCTALTSFTMPDSVATLGNGAFRHCEALTSVRLSSFLSAIPNIAFQYCEKLTSVDIGKNITKIGNSAFSYCYALRGIAIRGSISSFGDSAFYHCESISSIYFASDVPGDLGNAHFTFCRAGINGDGITLTLAPGARVPDGLFEPGEEENRARITAIVFEDGTTDAVCFEDYGRLPYLRNISVPVTLTSVTASIFRNDNLTVTVRPVEGYTIYGWYDNAFYTGEALDPAKYTGDGVKLYLHCSNRYSVSLKDTGLPGQHSTGASVYTYGDTVTLTAPDFTGYTFLGWYRNDVLISSDPVYAFVLSDKDESFVAKWTYYTLTTDTDMSEAGTSTSYTDEKITKETRVTLTAKAKAGYTFLGWYNGDELLSENMIYTFAMPAETLHITAKWAVYTLTVDSDMSVAGTSTSYTDEKTVRGTRVTLTAKVNAGYTFLGWYNGDELLSKDSVYTFDMPPENLHITAKWAVYTLTVDSDMSVAGTITSYTDEKTVRGTRVTLTAKVNAGYTFLGWYNGDKLLSEELVYTFDMPTESLHYTAKWRANTYKITFDTAGGNLSETTKTVTFGADTTLPVPMREYCQFLGWYYGDQKVVNGTWSIAANVALTAKWLSHVNVSENGTVTGLSSYGKTQSKIVILSEINGIVITSIDKQAFQSCSDLTSITISSSVTNIGDDAFSGCSGLREVHISNLAAWCKISFGSSTANPLYYAHNLYMKGSLVTNLTIPGSVTSIKNYAFYNCSSLISATIPSSVTSIGYQAFCNCLSLTSVTIPNSVTSIGSSAFYECTKLTNVTIPNSVTDINYATFWNCTGLTNVTLENGVAGIGRKAFYGCVGLTSITVPSSVTSIDSYAFEDCYKLIEVVNHSSLKITAGSNNYGYIGYYAKHIITDAKDTYLSTDENGYIFYDDGSNIYLVGYAGTDTELVLPETSPKGKKYEIYQYAFSWCTELTSVTIPNSVTSIGDSAFSGCSGLTSVTIPNSVTSIGEAAFSGCSELTSITIPSSVTSIDKYVFTDCFELTSITIPNGVTSIGEAAFANCSRLTSITFKGTKSQWNAISKGYKWNDYTGNYTIHCADGDISE